MPKTEQLQIRVSSEEKARIRNAASQAGLDMSEWIMWRLFSKGADEFERLTSALRNTSEPSFVLAALHDLLIDVNPGDFLSVVSQKPEGLSPFHANYIAGMLEHIAHAKGLTPPHWVTEIPPLEQPAFGSDLLSLRLYLLTESPPAFRRRNIFIDSTVGDRV